MYLSENTIYNFLHADEPAEEVLEDTGKSGVDDEEHDEEDNSRFDAVQ